MATIVKYRHIGMHEARVDSSHATRSDAEHRALEINNKPFTPYYAWLEEDGVASRPALNSFFGR